MTDPTKDKDIDIDEVTKEFIAHLHKEKHLHKEHRHKHLIQKLLLSGTFFGLGQIPGLEKVASLFLYAVPFVALIHDVYIFAEDFKVKRIGQFFRWVIYEKGAMSQISTLEQLWERDFLGDRQRKREQSAWIASLLYTLILTVLSTYLILVKGIIPSTAFFGIWLGVCILAVGGAFAYHLWLKGKTIKSFEEKKVQELLKSTTMLTKEQVIKALWTVKEKLSEVSLKEDVKHTIFATIDLVDSLVKEDNLDKSRIVENLQRITQRLNDKSASGKESEQVDKLLTKVIKWGNQNSLEKPKEGEKKDS